jgi:hypothetical protein
MRTFSFKKLSCASLGRIVFRKSATRRLSCRHKLIKIAVIGQRRRERERERRTTWYGVVYLQLYYNSGACFKFKLHTSVLLRWSVSPRPQDVGTPRAWHICHMGQHMHQRRVEAKKNYFFFTQNISSLHIWVAHQAGLGVPKKRIGRRRRRRRRRLGTTRVETCRKKYLDEIFLLTSWS